MKGGERNGGGGRKEKGRRGKGRGGEEKRGRQQRQAPSAIAIVGAALTLLQESPPQDSQCLPAEASWAYLVPTSKATHPPGCPHPRGNSQCPVVLGTSCEGRSQGLGPWWQQLAGELRRAERPGGKAQ